MDPDDLPKRAEDPPPLPELPLWVGIVIILGLCIIMGTCAYLRVDVGAHHLPNR